MTAKRKNASVLTIVTDFNRAIENTNEYIGMPADKKATNGWNARDWQMYRLGMSHIVEGVLMDSGNYMGYTLLPVIMADGTKDDSARQFYISNHLKEGI